MNFLLISTLLLLSACSTIPDFRRPASESATCKTLLNSLIHVDKRLQKFTKQLLDTAKKQKTGELIIESKYHETLQKLWPQHDLDFILNNPNIYKEPIADFPLMSNAQVRASLREKEVPEEVIETMKLVNIWHQGFDGEMHPGQLIVHQDAEESTIEIFKILMEESLAGNIDFPMTSFRPISLYDWLDELSVKMNNGSAFAPRTVGGTDEVSDHAFGSAIDINPYLNPWVKGGAVNDRYNVNIPGTLTADSEVVKIFKKHGWAWGGDWENSKDWQHFYRPEIPFNHFGKIEVPE